MSTPANDPTRLPCRPRAGLRLAAAAALLALLAGCASWLEEGARDGTGPEAEAAESAGLAVRGLDPDEPLDAAILDDPDTPLKTRRIHFAFDSSQIPEDALPVLKAHGEFLGEHPELRMTVEGHTDERGSRAYNLALGERRAEAVKELLRAHGAGTEQVETVSYGEEQPLVPESNEQAWAENRRAELVYDSE
ncbi:peptidoglycan-associated lipoprotein Pal [Halorhodospira neutriphila]|uniref:Peptidoglycan-associated protein n=1 Tax=Halorhodospira neutriphila TaxID=168379 RepID=A0ABS1E9C7_9GAMM|nr:peptidoglycan-associated lipoprotein Pal [Halorhodospira neutriphila]MBK1727304.1 peptidoglycan-associated lipoprotein [Halorhodospira neutriphila]